MPISDRLRVTPARRSLTPAVYRLRPHVHVHASRSHPPVLECRPTLAPPPVGASGVPSLSAGGRLVFRAAPRTTLPAPAPLGPRSVLLAPPQRAPVAPAAASPSLRRVSFALVPALSAGIAPPVGATPARAEAALANLATAQSLGMVEALVSSRSHSRWEVEPSSDERMRLALLREEVHSEAAIANAPTYQKELASALKWATLFRAEFPSRPLFVRNRDAGDSSFNAETKALLFGFVRKHGSIKKGHEGAPLKASSVEGTISTLFAFAGRLAEQEHLISPDIGETTFAQLRKRGREVDGPSGARRVEDPLRAQHLRAAFQGARPALERSSPMGQLRHATLLFEHNILGRTKEVCPRRQGEVDQGRDLVIASFDWDAAAAMAPPAVVVWVAPSKDPTQKKPRYPMLIQRRSIDAAFGADPMCTYDALLSVWTFLAEWVHPSLWTSTMFFRVPDLSMFSPPRVDHFVGPPSPERIDPSCWRPLADRDITRWVKEAAIAAGVDPSRRAGRALRMGGAADLYDIFGPAGERYIRERGRWASDVAQIYQRVSASAHGELSRVIGDSEGLDLQSMLSGWSQLAVSHGRCRL